MKRELFKKVYVDYKPREYPQVDEGKGFIPDYWIDDENPLGVVEEYVRKMI